MSPRRSGLFALWLLCAINLVNYLDRYIIAGALPRLEAAFGLSHTQAGLLGTVFMVVYMFASPLGGYLGDRVSRRYLIAVTVLLWSLATAWSGLAASFLMLLMARAATGIGEAGYGSAAPALLADLFPPEKRSRVLAYFYTAIPLGAAAGFVVGGAVSEAYSWNAAFFVGAVPGVLLAGLALLLPEPPRGATDARLAMPAPKLAQSLLQLSTSRGYWVATASLTLMTFSIGGLAYWMPTFLEKERAMSAASAGLALGAATVLGGFLGTVVGGLGAEALERRRPRGGLLLSGLGLLLAAPLMVLLVATKSPTLMFACLFAAQFLLFLNTGPLNAAIVDAVPAESRALAMGLSTLLVHLLGDAVSPTLIGWLGEQWSLALAIQLNAGPVLASGLLLLLAVRSRNFWIVEMSSPGELGGR